MMFRKILVVLIIVICLVSPAMSTAKRLTKNETRDGIIKNCERMYTGTSDLIYCILSQNYGHDKIVNYYVSPSSDEQDCHKLRELIVNKYKNRLKHFYGFVALHLEFGQWLEKKYKKNGM